MPCFHESKPAMCWLFFIAALGFAQWAVAAQMMAFESDVAAAAPVLALDAQERKYLAEQRQVVVALTQYPLYLFKDEHGHWSGFNNDVLERISTLTGLKFVYEETFSSDQLLQRLESGAADMSTMLSMNDERRAFLDFSHAYGGASWVLIGHSEAPAVQSLEQLAKKVLVLPTRHALEAVIRHEYPSIELRSVKTYAEARALVESGEAYATIDTEVGARLYPSGRLKVGAAIEGKWDADYLAVRKGQPQLLSILNKALEAFSPAELRAIRHKWFGATAPVATPSAWERLDCWSVVVCSVFALLCLVWNRRLTTLIQQRQDAANDLRDQLAFQHTLLDSMPDPMFVRDLQGRLVMCNKSYEEHLAIRFDQAQGRQLIELDIMPKATAELLHAELMVQLNTRKPCFSERQLLLHSGLKDVYQWTVPFYSADGQLRGLLGGWSDIGQRGRQA
ncbi:transporter substrate-binding domain-containing protein [Pseudomonas sp. Root562]|uniref:transporter substrate-binding domain-containing protein n=1 Tax=Pseudomonas sp. Root562 TaxID=1736561 RepID=UPI0007038BC1|nr:transporter substrate-binding domain-containing protein [Pseudomonas sp. Root562]KQZ91292.1 histidine kinase [Pseudomonas sp. Root562]